MSEFVARQNIRRFEAQLQGDCDSTTRATIEGLLEAERRRLEELLKQPELRSSER